MLQSDSIEEGSHELAASMPLAIAGRLERLHRPLWRPTRVGLPPPIAIDSVVAVLVAALTLVHDLKATAPHPMILVLAVLGSLCLAWRRSAPMLVLVLTASTFYGHQAAAYPHHPLPLAVLIALYTVAATNGTLIAALASTVLLASLVGSGVVRAGWPASGLDDLLIAYLLSLGGACALGYAVQLSRARTQLLAEQASRLAAEHEAHEVEMLQWQRSRIARDLHDVVAHQVSVITALAAGAGKVIDTEPGRARNALSSIELAGREALVEMRRLLRVLRADAPSELASPQPSLDDLEALAAQTTAAGVPVELSFAGTRRPLPPGVELCAYRIAQEALTNVLKHAGPARARVEFTYLPDGLVLEISDDGRSLPRDLTPGHGLVGMRERSELLGGRLVVGDDPAGGVRVRAWLPVAGSA